MVIFSYIFKELNIYQLYLVDEIIRIDLNIYHASNYAWKF